MFCTNCGYKNKQTARYCIDCGQPLDRITRIDKHRKRSKLQAIFLSLFLIAAGFGIAQLTQEPTVQPASMKTTAEPLSQEPPEAAEAAAQPEAKKERTVIIEETQEKVFTIKTDETSGTGFLFTNSGIIVTNAHVVAGNMELTVRNAGGEETSGHVIGISVVDDLALIQVEAYQGNEPIEVEHDLSAVGTEVIAFGSPSGFENTASVGYVTGTERDFYHNFTYKDMYQIDAQLAPGSSGGPLVDAATGKVIAINSIQYTDSVSIGFSIPMHTIEDLLTDWLDNPMSKEKVEELLDQTQDHEWSRVPSTSDSNKI